MTRSHILILCCVLFLSSRFAGESVVQAEESRPNIVWIFSDDHSYQTIGAYGGRLQSLNPSPNIDRIAKEGMRFDRCYVGNSICGPSRATLLTGKHSHMNGKYGNTKFLMKPMCKSSRTKRKTSKRLRGSVFLRRAGVIHYR